MSKRQDDDWEASPEWVAYRQNVIENLIPMLQDSSVVVSMVPSSPDSTDVKFAVELGFSIMMDKPIIALVATGAKIPPKLAKIADAIVEADLDDALGTTKRLHKALAGLGLDERGGT